jgi:hypothetical protein
MLDATYYTVLTIVAVIVFGLCAYILKGKSDQKKNKDGYRWKPEQDYDVVMRGETPMTPGFPVLKKRNKDKNPK